MYNPIRDTDKKTHSFDGFYRAIVMDVDDPLKAGRVRVKVMPFFADILTDHLPWAIYADNMMGGHANNGGLFVPDLYSHVFVFFENGDHRFPVYFAAAPAIQNDVPDAPTWTRETDDTFDEIDSSKKTGVTKAGGGSWDTPDASYNSTYPNNKVFKTTKGITVEYDDTDGNVRIHVYHPSGTREEVNNEGDRIEHNSANKFTITITDDNIYVGGDQNITVIGNQTIKVNGTQTVELNGIGIKATGDVKIEAGGNVDIKAGGNTTIKGSLINLN